MQDGMQDMAGRIQLAGMQEAARGALRIQVGIAIYTMLVECAVAAAGDDTTPEEPTAHMLGIDALAWADGFVKAVEGKPLKKLDC
jgi:hypothetical protein